MSAVRGPREPAVLRWAWLNWPGRSRRLATVSFFALVNWLMLAPADTFEDVQVFLAHQDKIAHGAIFTALALLVRWAVPRGWARGRPRVAVPALLALYAGSIEVFQPLLAGSDRLFEWPDMAANLTGIAAGWLLFRRMAAGESPAAGDLPGLRLLKGDPQ